MANQKVVALVSVAFVLAAGLVSLLLSCIIPNVYWNLFIILPLLFVPIPYLFFSSTTVASGPSGWKSFAEFLSGFFFSTSWAIVGIAYHLQATTGLSFGLGILANIMILGAIVLFFYWESKETFSDGFF